MNIVVVTTRGRGSMDRYGAELAAHVGADVLDLDLARASPGTFGAPPLGGRALRGALGDRAVVRRLRAADGLLHLTNHHLLRYAGALRRPFVATVHDLIRYFDLVGPDVLISRPNARDRRYLRRELAGAARAAAIVAVSETTRRDLIVHLGIDPDRVFVVHEGIDHDRFRPVPERLVDRPYVLFVGSEHPRKNLVLALRAFAEARRDPRSAELLFVKVGAAGTDEAPFRAAAAAAVRELGLERDVLFTGEVADELLPAWYSGAACLVQPSRYEGFGLPPVEAMACGCPVIVSDAGALPEIADGAALVVGVDDVDGWSRAIGLLARDDAARAALRERGLERARAFTWERAAHETIYVYRRTLTP